MERTAHRPAPLPLAYALAACLVLLSVAPAAQSGRQAQAEAQDQSEQQTPVFRSGANFVLVDAYPRRDGRLVPGLTIDDFIVFEDGTRQTISEFQFIEAGGLLGIDERIEPSSAADAERQAADPRNGVFVLFLDGNHTRLQGTRDAIAPGVEFLNQMTGPGDLFAVATPDVPASRLTFTRQLASAQRQLREHWDAAFIDNASASIVKPRTQHEIFLYQCFQGRYLLPAANDALVRRLISRARTEQVLKSLDELFVRLTAIREARSHVLVFSGGWSLQASDPDLMQHAWQQQAALSTRFGRPVINRSEPGVPRNAAACDGELQRMSFVDYRLLFQDVIDEGRRSNIAVHAIDPSGLSAFDDDRLMTRERPARGVSAMPGVDRLGSLRVLADATDGVAMVGTNNIMEPIRQLARELSSYYLLGYDSSNLERDGRFRKIEVRLKEPDMEVSARRGYLAMTEEAVRAMDAARDAARAEPAAPSGAAVALEELALLDGVPDAFVRAVVIGDQIVVTAESTERALGRYLMEGSTSEMVVSGPDGEAVGEDRHPFEAGRTGTVHRVDVSPDDAGPWEARVRFQGDVSPITFTVEVARPAASPLSGRLVYRATPASRSPLWPAPSLQFRRAERVHVEWAAAGPLDTRSARLLGRDGNPLDVPVTLTEIDRDGVALLAADLRVAPLAPGDYVIEVTASLNGESRVEFVAIRVTQ